MSILVLDGDEASTDGFGGVGIAGLSLPCVLLVDCWFVFDIPFALAAFAVSAFAYKLPEKVYCPVFTAVYLLYLMLASDEGSDCVWWYFDIELTMLSSFVWLPFLVGNEIAIGIVIFITVM